jgi:hypothetical protein
MRASLMESRVVSPRLKIVIGTLLRPGGRWLVKRKTPHKSSQSLQSVIQRHREALALGPAAWARVTCQEICGNPEVKVLHYRF